MNTKKAPKVSIIILCNNSKRWLKTCISSVLNTTYENYNVLLVDNASTDGSVEEISAEYPEVVILRNQLNMGWCLGNNIGIEYAMNHGAEYIYLSNADVRFCQPMWLSYLVEFMQDQPQYHVVGPLQYDYDNPQKFNSWTRYILENGNRDVHYMWSRHITSNTKQYNYSSADMSKKVLDVSFVQGSAMLVTAESFRQIGLFDPLYYIFFDELDFCRRNLRVGNCVGVVPQSSVQHFGSGDCSRNRKQQRKRNFYFSRNKYYYLLSDYNTQDHIKKEITRKWLLNDLKQSLQKNSDVSDPLQWLHIVSDIVLHRKACAQKREHERILERCIIEEKLHNAPSPECFAAQFGIKLPCRQIPDPVDYVMSVDLWAR